MAPPFAILCCPAWRTHLGERLRLRSAEDNSTTNPTGGQIYLSPAACKEKAKRLRAKLSVRLISRLARINALLVY